MIHYKKRLYGNTKNISMKEPSYIKLALLFGSRATDSANSKSNYDIDVLTEPKVDAPWGVEIKL